VTPSRSRWPRSPPRTPTTRSTPTCRSCGPHDITLRALTRDGHLVGSISSFVMEGHTEITYWIERSAWGQGIAGQLSPCSSTRSRSGPCMPAPPATPQGPAEGRLHDHQHRDLLRIRPRRRNGRSHPASRLAPGRRVRFARGAARRPGKHRGADDDRDRSAGRLGAGTFVALVARGRPAL
jgi:hypothetical protein